MNLALTTSDKIPYCVQQSKRGYTRPKSSTCGNVVGYNKLVTSGNNPTISKAMRYAVYIRTQRSKPVV
jgi:hypothetical protein